MRTMNQQLACSFRCARRTLPWFIELIRASLAVIRAGDDAPAGLSQRPTSGEFQRANRLYASLFRNSMHRRTRPGLTAFPLQDIIRH